MVTPYRRRLLGALGAVTIATALSLAGLHTDAGFTRTITNLGNSASSTNRLRARQIAASVRSTFSVVGPIKPGQPPNG